MLNYRVSWFFALTLCVVMIMIGPRPVSASKEITAKAKKFVDEFTAKYRPLEITGNKAWWDANISGKDEDYKRKEGIENQINELLSNKGPGPFQEVKGFIESGGIDDPIIKRSIEVIFLTYLGKHVDAELLKKMTALENSLMKKFGNFRAVVEGKEMDDAAVRNALKTSTLSEKRKEVYLAGKEVGKVLEKELLELVGLRNQAATKLGFKNYHALQLYLNEQDGGDLIKLFDDLDKLTREPFKKAKAEIDVQLAKNCGIAVKDLMPWHYHDPFFQEVPSVFSADLDKIYENADLIKLCRDFYKSIGLPIDLVIERTGDFAPRKGKNPHAFCTDITRDGTDVRVLANVVNNEYWMSTLLHEFGHSVYTSINIPLKLPYVLRTEAHILTTEGIAMMFEKLSKERAWLEKMGVKVENAKEFDETAEKMQRYRLLIFSRWCQVMLRFEKGMYENPKQDLNKLWWDMVETYQLLRRPPDRSAPDYASKIHITAAPVYYHNYMMGELFAAQLHHAIARDVNNGADPKTVVYVGNKKVGDFLRQKVFEPGRTKTWNELTRYATGEYLSPAAFAKDFSGK
jgi:peptidyl-dipeptidase A